MPHNDRGEIEYTEVVSVDSVSKDALYSRAKTFVASAFNSSTDVTKLDDPATSTLITKGFLPRIYLNPFNRTQGGHVQFTFTIQAKDGRYRYSVKDLQHIETGTGLVVSGGPLESEKPAKGMSKKSWRHIKKESHSQITGFIDELKKTMAANSPASDKDNW
jgi:hypothetical protein